MEAGWPIIGWMLYRALARPLLFALPAETAHTVVETALGATPLWRMAAPVLGRDSPRLRTVLCGLELSSPIGLAAGFDKSFSVSGALAHLGFGYLSAGTVTLEPRDGNPGPRLVRDPGKRALVNSMGFPNPGSERAARRLRQYAAPPPLVASVSGTGVEEVVACHRRVESHAAAVEINISSPNTAGLRAFHDPAALADLLSAVGEGKRRPLFVKLPVYLDSADGRSAAMALVRACADGGVDGLTVANSRPVSDDRLAVGSGGLSGGPLLGETLRMVREVRAELGDGIAINACGGIFDGGHAVKALAAGASTVQIYTALVYRGPAAVGAIKREMLAAMDAAGAEDLAALSKRS